LVKVISIDEQDRVKLSRKQAMREQGIRERPHRTGSDRGRGARRP